MAQSLLLTASCYPLPIPAMLIPLTRKTFETLVPKVATGPQYLYYWGKVSDFLRRALISVVGMSVIVLIFKIFLVEGLDLILLLTGIVVGLYWLWGPVLWASLRNLEWRKFPYSGFWQGEVLDAYVTEELIGTEETVNERGDLVLVENRERCFNLEVGDDTGFTSRLRVPLKRSHQAISIGDTAEMLVLSNRGDLGRISQTSDIYISNGNIWVSDYPYLEREAFVDVSRRINERELYDRERRRAQDREATRDYPDTGRGGAIEKRQPRQRQSRRRPMTDS